MNIKSVKLLLENDATAIGGGNSPHDIIAQIDEINTVFNNISSNKKNYNRCGDKRKIR